MYNISLKYKRFLFFIVKITIVLAALYFIFEKLASNELLSFSLFKEQLSSALTTPLWMLIGILLFTDANWLLEILKWKTLVSVEKKITFLEAFEQCLASLTASIITPNRIGEYGAKAMFFERKKRKNIMALNFVGNIIQLATTIVFGLYGIFFLIKNFNFEFPEINSLKFSLILILIAILYFFRKQLKINKLNAYLKKVPKKIYLEVISYSILRYLFFSHQFYFLLMLFGVETNYFTLISLIFCMYILASIIPSLAVFDWVIKGSIAIWLFGLIGLNELTVATVTSFMWIFNFAIPSLIGSVFVLNFKLTDK